MSLRFATDRWLIAFFLVAVLLLIGLDAQRHLSEFAHALEARGALRHRVELLSRLRESIAHADVALAEQALGRGDQAAAKHRAAREDIRLQLQAWRQPGAGAPAVVAQIDALVARHLDQLRGAQGASERPAYPVSELAVRISDHAELDALFDRVQAQWQTELDSELRASQTRMQGLVSRLSLGMALGIALVLALGLLHTREARVRAQAQTRAKEAQKALQRANGELQRANESYLLALDDIAYRHLVHERRIEWGGAYTKVLGYDAHEIGSSEESWTSRIHPEDAPRVRGEFERARREHLLFDLEYRFRHRDGQWRWMYDRGVPHFDSAGQVVEVIGVLRDITGMRAEQAEREAAAYRLRSVLDHMSEGFVVLDREARYLSVNERACELLRTRREDLIGRTVWDCFPDSADAAVREASTRSIEDNQVRHLEILHEPWNVWFEVDIYPTHEGLTYFLRDITQRKLSERSLRDSRVRQELALWEVGVWEWDLRNDTLYLSPEWKSQLGHADHEIGNSFDEWQQRLHPAECEEMVRRVRWAAQPGRTSDRFELEFRMRHKDGSFRWILSRGVTQSDAAGEPALLRGVHLDISDRKRAEQERSEAQRRLQHIISSIRDGFVTLDRNWNYTYVNDAAALLLGRRREELVGHNIWSLFPESRMLPFHDACMRCAQLREPVQLDQYYAPHFRWYRNHFYSTDDGVAIFFEDFTARKRLEAQLADERERYRATFEQHAIGILHVALEGTVTRSNERMARMLGYERIDLVGLACSAILIEPDVREILDDVQHPSRGGASRLIQCRFRRRTGEAFWGEMTLAFVPGEGERPGYVVCMVQDISDRKQAETLLEESRQRLNAFAQQLTEAIEQERARISREIHDELGQALTRLKMDLGWLRRRLGENAQAGSLVAERVLEMGRFIDETLVSVRRLATELRPALLDNLGLAAALNAQMRQLAAQAEIEVTQHLEPDLPLSSEQATGLYRIAQEALTNIVRHANARKVRCVLFLDNEGVTMEIQDDGRGFDSAVQPMRGLGLVGIAERARLLGGFAAVESEPGRGTLVRVHLPTETDTSSRIAG